MKILANVTIEKRKEYSQSYGGVKTIEFPFVKDFGNEIHLLDKTGYLVRVMRTGTKLLISHSGTEISERAFNGRVKKAQKEADQKRAIAQEEADKRQKERAIIVIEQAQKWENLLKNNPEKIEKYKAKIKEMNSSKWRNYLNMKFAKNCNSGTFQNIEISAGELKSILLSL